MNLYVLVFLVLVSDASANCGCLKCSKHLQAVDIRGPHGRPIKVIFKRPPYDCCKACCTSGVPLACPSAVSEAGKGCSCCGGQCCPEPLCHPPVEDCAGKRYCATLEAVLPIASKVPCRLLNNLRYRTDTVLVPPPTYPALNPSPTCDAPSDLIAWLRNLQTYESALLASDAPLGTSPVFMPSVQCCDCQPKAPQRPCACNRPKRNVNVNNDASCILRGKRDLAKHSYNFLMQMLPQFVRDPVRHSIRGVRVEPPKPNLKQKVFDLINKSNKAYDQPAKPLLPKQDFWGHLKGQDSKFQPGQVNPSFAQRARGGVLADESTLLRKLKKLNNNPFCSDIEDQATVFVKGLLKSRRGKRSSKALSRSRRTIILSSDEIDLPSHYEVDIVSEEEEEPEAVEQSMEEDGESPLLGDQGPFRLPLTPRRFLPRFPTKPDGMMGKVVIQRAVREELDAYHKKLEREQKLKHMQQRRQEASVVPHNPVFMLLTAPMTFLKHFHDLNKGVAPVMTSLPKLVYTAKKYFRDFGKNFQKNCLNLASDIIGDFDHVQPNVIERISETRSRYRRDLVRNFRPASEGRARKKRYVVKVVDDREIQDQLEQYLVQNMEQYSYLQPLQDYYDKFNDFIAKLYSSHQPLCERGGESFYYRPATQEEHSQTRPKKKKVQIKKMKPRVIIDNKGLPFMEYDGFKRPLLVKGKKFALAKKQHDQDKSSEETGNRIATLIARAKEDSEVVGSTHKDIMPQQTVKERISSLLEEIDELVHLNAEDYDEIFEHLIKVQHLKTSIEQDWKRILIDNRSDDIGAKIGLLSKFKDLQQAKDEGAQSIVRELQKNDNEFVRRQLVHSLIRLQKLQCVIASVVEDFEQHLKTRTSYNTKKEIKYVDFMSEIKFVYAKTRNDLMRKLCRDRDAEGQRNIELVHKLKRLLVASEADPEKFERAAKLIWETKNLKKLQTQTIDNMNKKSSRIKKELKILFDLQKRFEECGAELNELLGNFVGKATSKGATKKDIKDVVAEIRQRHEEVLLKARNRAENLQRLKNS